MKSILLTLAQSVTKPVPTEIGGFAAMLSAFIGQFAGYQSLVPAIGILGVLVALDMLTGVRASRIEGQPIMSAKLVRTTDKIIAHLVGVLVIVLLAAAVPQLQLYGPAVSLSFVGWLCFKESWSIFENLDRLGTPLPKFIQTRLRAVERALGEE